MRYVHEARLKAVKTLSEQSVLSLQRLLQRSSPLQALPKGSKYHYSRSLVGVWAPKVYTILLLGPFALCFGVMVEESV